MDPIRYKIGDTVSLKYRIDKYVDPTLAYEGEDLTDNDKIYFSMLKDGDDNWIIDKKACNILSELDDNGHRSYVSYDFATGETDTIGMYIIKFTRITPEGKVATYPDYDTQKLFIYDDRYV